MFVEGAAVFAASLDIVQDWSGFKLDQLRQYYLGDQSLIEKGYLRVTEERLTKEVLVAYMKELLPLPETEAKP